MTLCRIGRTSVNTLLWRVAAHYPHESRRFPVDIEYDGRDKEPGEIAPMIIRVDFKVVYRAGVIHQAAEVSFCSTNTGMDGS